MKKILMTLAAVLCCAMTIQAQLLYKISGGGLTEPSYILGTNHYASISFVDSIPGLRRVMNDTQQVYTESKSDSESDDDGIAANMFLPDGMTLDSLLTADEMQRFSAFMMDSFKLDSVKLTRLCDLKPAAIIYLIIHIQASTDNSPQTNGLHSFDDYFKREALAQGKEVGGLETREFQYKLLFDLIPLERQKVLLMCKIDNPHPEKEDDFLELYYAKDLDAIWKAFIKPSDRDGCDYTIDEKGEIVIARNLAWMKKIPSVMSSKSTLFVVGALHVAGPDGVLNMLRKAGYTVEAVKE